MPAGTYSQTGAADLTQGLADCSSAVEDLVNLMDGMPTGGREMSTGNAAEWLQSRGFLPGTGGPGDFRVGFNAGHMQATLPGGTNFNWGSQSAADRGGVGGSGASDPSLTQRYYRPTSGSPVSAGTPLSSSAPLQTYSTPDLYSPANTSPGLTDAWAGPVGVPAGITGGAGESPIFGATPPGPGIGGAVGDGLGGQAYPAAGGVGGSVGMSGSTMGLINAAASAGGLALDAFAPGAGQAAAAAAQIGVEVGNRTIQLAGEAAGIGVGGLIQTFSPAGDDPKASLGNSWFGKIAGGLAGARPSIPNTAGQTAQKPKEQGQQGSQGQQGNTVNVTNNLTNNHATEDVLGNQLVREQMAVVGTQPGKQ